MSTIVSNGVSSENTPAPTPNPRILGLNSKSLDFSFSNDNHRNEKEENVDLKIRIDSMLSKNSVLAAQTGGISIADPINSASKGVSLFNRQKAIVENMDNYKFSNSQRQPSGTVQENKKKYNPLNDVVRAEPVSIREETLSKNGSPRFLELSPLDLKTESQCLFGSSYGFGTWSESLELNKKLLKSSSRKPNNSSLTPDNSDLEGSMGLNDSWRSGNVTNVNAEEMLSPTTDVSSIEFYNCSPAVSQNHSKGAKIGIPMSEGINENGNSFHETQSSGKCENNDLAEISEPETIVETKKVVIKEDNPTPTKLPSVFVRDEVVKVSVAHQQVYSEKCRISSPLDSEEDSSEGPVIVEVESGDESDLISDPHRGVRNGPDITEVTTSEVTEKGFSKTTSRNIVEIFDVTEEPTVVIKSLQEISKENENCPSVKHSDFHLNEEEFTPRPAPRVNNSDLEEILDESFVKWLEDNGFRAVSDDKTSNKEEKRSSWEFIFEDGPSQSDNSEITMKQNCSDNYSSISGCRTEAEKPKLPNEVPFNGFLITTDIDDVYTDALNILDNHNNEPVPTDTTEASASGKTTEASASGNTPEASASGNTTEASASGNTTEASASGNTTEASASGNTTEEFTHNNRCKSPEIHTESPNDLKGENEEPKEYDVLASETGFIAKPAFILDAYDNESKISDGDNEVNDAMEKYPEASWVGFSTLYLDGEKEATQAEVAASTSATLPQSREFSEETSPLDIEEIEADAIEETNDGNGVIEEHNEKPTLSDEKEEYQPVTSVMSVERDDDENRSFCSTGSEDRDSVEEVFSSISLYDETTGLSRTSSYPNKLTDLISKQNRHLQQDAVPSSPRPSVRSESGPGKRLTTQQSPILRRSREVEDISIMQFDEDPSQPHAWVGDESESTEVPYLTGEKEVQTDPPTLKSNSTSPVLPTPGFLFPDEQGCTCPKRYSGMSNAPTLESKTPLSPENNSVNTESEAIPPMPDVEAKDSSTPVDVNLEEILTEQPHSTQASSENTVPETVTLNTDSVVLKCPHCQSVVGTKTVKKISLTYACCIAPMFVDRMKDVEHWCPECNFLIGKCPWKPFDKKL